MNDENQARIKSEVDGVLNRITRDKIRDEYCNLKARTLHTYLPFFARQCVSVEVLAKAMTLDWDHREGLYAAPYLQVSQEDLLLHLLRNPQILKEPELVFLGDLIKLERGIFPDSKKVD